MKKHTISRAGQIVALALAGVILPYANAAQAQESDGKSDTSGTNPTVLTRSFNLLNEYRSISGGGYFNTTTLRFTQPFNEGRMSFRLNVPLPATDLPGSTRFGVGDISGKLTWVAYLDRRQGIVLTGEFYAPTASQPFFGTGKWVASPGLTYAYFLTREIIIAPAYVHNISYAGDAMRPRVNRGDFDLYVVYKPKGQNWWLTSDMQVSYDFVNNKKPAAWKVALGTNLGKIGDAAVNLSLKPGIGIGVDKPFKWSFEVGLSVIGF